MSYKALLFCPEQKTLRTVTQILTELDFEIEACHEPFAAVKRLTTEHFDAIVVDCENEQNATLLFKSSRHSSSNRSALSIAVVEGQAGVASAFRIGANLVLTKPINVEQSKGTIRVARGLLRKSEAPKPAHSLVGTPAFLESAVAIAEPRGTTMRETAAHTFPKQSAGFSESEFEREKDPEVRPEATEAALLESMQDPASEVLRAREAESQAAAAKQQAITNPVASALHPAGQAADGGRASDFRGGAAAVAPAPAPAESFEEQRKILSEVPMFSTAIGESEPEQSGGGKKKLLIAVVVLLLGVGVYLALQKTHVQSTPSSSAPAVTGPQAAPAPAAQPTSPEPSSTTPAQPSGDTSPAHRGSGSEKTPASTRTPAKTKKSAWPVAPHDLRKQLV
jgi:CheY-like chemotaxis protein